MKKWWKKHFTNNPIYQFKMSYSGCLIYLLVAGFLDVEFLSSWAKMKHMDIKQAKRYFV